MIKYTDFFILFTIKVYSKKKKSYLTILGRADG